MEWVWDLYRDHVHKTLSRAGNSTPTDGEVEKAFLEALAQSTVTVLVQEPWQNSVRFKGLVRLGFDEMPPLLNDPMTYLRDRFGGGKYKLNFHRGWNFVATQNFKPEGPPKWRDLPEIDVSNPG